MSEGTMITIISSSPKSTPTLGWASNMEDSTTLVPFANSPMTIPEEPITFPKKKLKYKFNGEIKSQKFFMGQVI